MINIERLLLTAIFSLVFCSTMSYSQKINQLDGNGKKNGLWKKYYPNGKPRYEGTFLNGKEVGTFKFYRNTSAGVPHIIKKFTADSDVAEVQFFNQVGKLKAEGNMIGKNREGHWKYYFTNGEVFSEEYYKNGKLEGMLKNYYANGNVTEETEYKNGAKHGTSKIYTEGGILIEEVNYANGKTHGLAKYYDLKGVIKEKGSYQNGTRVGEWEFYIDGEVAKKPGRITHSVPKSN